MKVSLSEPSLDYPLSIDVRTWNLESVEDLNAGLQEYILTSVNEVLKLAVEQGADVWFDSVDDRNEVPDISVYIPFSAHSDDLSGPRFKFSLQKVVEEFLTGLDPFDSHLTRAHVMSGELRALADQIDICALEMGKEEKVAT